MKATWKHEKKETAKLSECARCVMCKITRLLIGLWPEMNANKTVFKILMAGMFAGLQMEGREER